MYEILVFIDDFIEIREFLDLYRQRNKVKKKIVILKCVCYRLVLKLQEIKLNFIDNVYLSIIFPMFNIEKWKLDPRFFAVV